MKKAREESRCEQGQSEAQHEWDNESDRDDRHRVQMTNDDETDSRTLTGGDITKYRALVARNSYLSQDRPDHKFWSMQARCAMASPTVRDWERVKRIGRYLAGRPRVATWEPSLMRTGEVTQPLAGQCRVERS